MNAPCAALRADQLTVDHLDVRRGPCLVVRDAGFTALAGQVTALIGPNGAGKSTVLKAVLGLLPSTGRIELDGADLRRLPADRRARLIGYIPQRSQLSAALRVAEVVAMGRFAHVGPLGRLSSADACAVDQALADADAMHLAKRAFCDLSAGEQQRVLVARALAGGSGAVLMDEPTAALDVGHVLAFEELLRRLADSGRVVVVVLHQLDEVRRVADRAVLFARGRVEAAGSTAEVLDAGHLRRVFGVEPVPGAGLGFRRAAAP